MSDPTTDTLRRTMKAITEIAPEAPAIETVSDRSGRKIPIVSGGGPPRGWRGPATALVAAVAVLVVVGVGALGATWLRSSDSAPGATTEPVATEGWIVLAFLSDDPDVDPETIMGALATRPAVIAARYVAKPEALAEALELFAENKEIIRVLEESPDLLPASVRVLTDSQARAQAIASDAAEMPGVVFTDLYFGTLDELPTPDPYDPPEVTSDTSTTTLAMASGIITIDALYTPRQFPVIRSVTIRNGTGEPVDISGWSLATKGNEANAAVFPEDAILVPGGAASVFQFGATARDCPESTLTHIYVCYDPFRAPTSLAFPSWPVLLLDRDGVIVGEWSPG